MPIYCGEKMSSFWKTPWFTITQKQSIKCISTPISLYLFMCMRVCAGGGSGVCGLLHVEVSQSRSVEPAPRWEHAGQWRAILRHISDIWWEACGCGGNRTSVLWSVDPRWVQTSFCPPGLFLGLEMKCSNEKSKAVHACNFDVCTLKQSLCTCSYNTTCSN